MKIKIRKDIVEKLESISNELGVNPNDLANKIIEEYLEDKIFEERARKALESIEASGVKGKPASEFLKELETW